MLLDGVHVPLTTPFYPDGRVYLRKLEHNVRRYSLTPVSGLMALGSVSEMESLSDSERREVLKVVATEAAREKVLLAGVGLPGVRESLALAEEAAVLGFDAVVVAAPAEFRHLLWQGGEASSALSTYFEAIADGSRLPVVLASDASRVALPPSLIEKLSQHHNIIAVLEQSAHIGRVAEIKALTAAVRYTATTTITFTAATSRMLKTETSAEVVGGTFVSAASLGGGAAVATAPPVPALKTRTKEVGFQVIWCAATEATEAMRAGANGMMPPLAASVPQAAFEVWAAWKDGNAALMTEKQGRMTRAENGIAGFDIPSIKAGSELSGYFGGRPRLPLLPVTAERAAEIATLLHGMRS